MATWTTPTNFAAGAEVTSTKLNEQVIADLLYLYEGTAQWTTFTPTWSNVTLGSGSATYGRYRRSGNIVEFQAGVKLGTGGSVTGVISMTGPLSLAGISGFAIGGMGSAVALDLSAGARYPGGFYASSGTTWVSRLFESGDVGWDADEPFTWEPNDELHVWATIEVSP